MSSGAVKGVGDRLCYGQVCKNLHKLCIKLILHDHAKQGYFIFHIFSTKSHFYYIE